jgi:hypothetical protein
MKDPDLIPILRWRRALPGELGGGSLWGMLPEKSYVALNKADLVERMGREVDAGKLPAAALATLDSGVSPEILKRLGYSREDLAKAEAAVEDLFKKGAAERVLRQEDLTPVRRPGRPVKIDADELERLRKIEAIVTRFIGASGGPRQVHPSLREAAELDDDSGS